MSRRMIASEIWRNEKFGYLSLPAKLLFIGMFSTADDDGRLKALPKYLKACIMPYEEITTEQVEKCRQECIDNGLVKLYKNGTSEYLYCYGWLEHQRVRKDLYKPSRLPPPPRNETEKPKAGTESAEPVTEPLQERNGNVTKPYPSIVKYSIVKNKEKVSKVLDEIDKHLGLLVEIKDDNLKEIMTAVESAGDFIVIEALKKSEGKSWAYAKKILTNWAKDGLPDKIQKIVKEKDPDRFVKGRYGHMVQR